MWSKRVRLVSLLGRLVQACKASIPQLSPTHVSNSTDVYCPPAASFPSTTFLTANTCLTTAHTFLKGKGAEVGHEHRDEIRVQRLQRLRHHSLPNPCVDPVPANSMRCGILRTMLAPSSHHLTHSAAIHSHNRRAVLSFRRPVAGHAQVVTTVVSVVVVSVVTSVTSASSPSTRPVPHCHLPTTNMA